jgi:hypothetical protein
MTTVLAILFAVAGGVALFAVGRVILTSRRGRFAWYDGTPTLPAPDVPNPVFLFVGNGAVLAVHYTAMGLVVQVSQEDPNTRKAQSVDVLIPFDDSIRLARGLALWASAQLGERGVHVPAD